MLLDLGFLNVSLLGSLSFVTPLGELAVQHPSTLFHFILAINAIAFSVAFFTKMFRVYEDVKINLKIGIGAQFDRHATRQFNQGRVHDKIGVEKDDFIPGIHDR